MNRIYHGKSEFISLILIQGAFFSRNAPIDHILAINVLIRVVVVSKILDE